ncbi:MAG: Gfo/Idh/MocA family oxidoreductase [Verrucomicrobiota bacterium]
MKSKPIRWGILGPGSIAQKFATGLHDSDKGVLVAVGSRSHSRASAFLNGINTRGAKGHGDYESLLSDPDVDAIYVATPHTFHREWCVKAVAAGKHVLCEKPIAINHADAKEIFTVAEKNGLQVMEAFMYRCHPQTKRLVQLIREGSIGEVRRVQAEFGFRAEPNPQSRLFDSALGGGAILDIGCYPMSLARLVAGVANGVGFLEPYEIRAVGNLHPTTKVDTSTSAVLGFKSGVIAELFASLEVNAANQVIIEGTEGSLVLSSPWFCRGPIKINRSGKASILPENPDTKDLYSYEADVFAEYLSGEALKSPAMTPEDTLGNMKALDQWRAEIGVIYPSEKT